MPIVSFYKIKEKSNRIILLLMGGLFLYWLIGLFFITQAVYMVCCLFSSKEEISILPVKIILFMFSMAVLITLGHYFLATRNIIKRTIKVFRAQDIDPGDPYHKLFRDTVEEISIATGTSASIKCMVIPCTSTNGFVLQDHSRNAIVGVTEGLLARAKRNEIQAVVAQLTARILTKDAFISTVAFSLFSSFENFLTGLLETETKRYYGGYETAVESNPFMLILHLGNLINVFLSRKQILRNDSLAVELTRDPMALAQILRRMQYTWRGSGTFSNLTESVLFASPGKGSHDKQLTFFQKLYKAQPPIDKRLKNALDMAGKNLGEIDELLKDKSSQRAIGVEKNVKSGDLWKIFNGDTWEGPFDLAVLATMPWITPITYILRAGTDSIISAGEDNILSVKLFGKETQKELCPRCQSSLNEMRYEGVNIISCSGCGGKFVSDSDIQRIMIRDIVPVSPYIRSKAKEWKEFKKNSIQPKIERNPPDKLSCPVCGHEMGRHFFNTEYTIQIDRCYYCKRTWFDKDELELLQALIQEATESFTQTTG